MHDINKSGWNFLIPLYNIYLIFLPGTRGNNDYGIDPSPIKNIQYFDEIESNTQDLKEEVTDSEKKGGLDKWRDILVIAIAAVLFIAIAAVLYYVKIYEPQYRESYNVNIESEPVVHSPETPVYNSEYFADVVSSNEGDFIGLNLGDSRETVKGKLPEEAFDDETDSYLYYYWEFGEHLYYLDLYFDETGNLNSIDGYLYFYDADYNYDEAAAKAFYTDMKDLFVSKYGSEEEAFSDEDYSYWFLDGMDVEVGLDGGEVQWHIDHY